MKMKTSILILFAIILFDSNKILSQDQFYYYEGEKINLYTDSSSIVLIFNEEYYQYNRYDELSTIPNLTWLIASDGEEDLKLAVLNFDHKINNVLNQLESVDLDESYFDAYGYGYKDQNDHYFHSHNQVLTKLIIDIEDQAFKDLLDQYEAEVTEETKYGTVVIETKNLTTAFELSNILYEDGFAVYAEPNFNAEISTADGSSNPYFINQFYLENILSGSEDMDIDAQQAWEVTKGDPNIRVAVIGTGVDLNHEDLSNVVNGFTPGGCCNGNTATPGCIDDGHETAVAGIIGADDNNIGIIGVAPNVTIVPFRITKGLQCNEININNQIIKKNIFKSNFNIGRAINKAWDDFDCDVLNNSWEFETRAPSSYVADAINNAATQGRNGNGSVVVVSSGNVDPLSFPADLPNVFTVSGVKRDGEFDGNDFGPEVNVTAFSGVGNFSIWSTDIMGEDGYNSTSTQVINNNYASFLEGTSYSAPQVSGVAALLLSRNPGLTRQQVQCRIEQTAVDIGDFGKDDKMGWGLVNAYLAIAYDTMNIDVQTFWGLQNLYASQLITSNNTTITDGADVTYTAGEQIIYGPGFHAESGSKHHGHIDPSSCGPCEISELQLASIEICEGEDLCFIGADCASSYSIEVFSSNSSLVYQDAGSINSSSFCTWNTANVAAGVYTVKADFTSNSGSNQWSFQYTVVVLSCQKGMPTLGIKENDNDGVKVYPNPNRGTFTVELPRTKTNGVVTLSNLSGRDVLSRKINGPSTDLRLDVSSGVYILTVQCDEKKYFEKIVIQ